MSEEIVARWRKIETTSNGVLDFVKYSDHTYAWNNIKDGTYSRQFTEDQICSHFPLSNTYISVFLQLRPPDWTKYQGQQMGCDIADEPKNNDGRDSCFWCGSPTKRVPGGMPSSFYDICTKKGCER